MVWDCLPIGSIGIQLGQPNVVHLVIKCELPRTTEWDLGQTIRRPQKMEFGDKEPKEFADQKFPYKDTAELNHRWALWTKQAEQWIYRTLTEPTQGTRKQHPKLRGQYLLTHREQ